MDEALPIAVLISGGGTTLRNLIERAHAGSLPIDIRLVISSSPEARGLVFARKAKIPTLVVEKKKETSPEAFTAAIFAPCREASVKYVVMGGFLKHVPIPSDFENRVINIHPALIPAFCGRGMYGQAVHQAVLDYGAKLTGCTVHFVDNEYDHGPVILQRAIEVRDDDTPQTLAARVFEAECQALPDALNLLAAGKVKVAGRRVIVGQ